MKMIEPQIRAELEFRSTEDGGFPWALSVPRIMVRFPGEPDMNYGAVIFSERNAPIEPGEKVVVGIGFLNFEGAKRYLRQDAEFVFGDLRDRGHGRVLELIA